jgi:hypothetical protein
MRFKVPKQQPESFRASALYLAGRTRGHSPDRVEFVEARNLHSTDPEGAALVMDATAAKSARCRQPAYHFIITFDPKDAAAGKVTPEVKRQVADAILRDMGLSEHQALVYSHRDTDHPHLHFLVNRVHPTRHIAFDRHQDGRRLAGIVQERAREFGLNILRPRDLEKERDRERVDDLSDMPPAPTDAEYWKARREGREAQVPFARDEIAALRGLLKDDFAGARSWPDLSARLARHGITLERKGQGLILTDGARVAKLSDMGKGVRFQTLEARFGERYDDFLARSAADRLARSPERGREKNRDTASALSPQEDRTVRAMEASEPDARRRDPVVALDNADLDYRYWAGVEASYRMADRRVGALRRVETQLERSAERHEAARQRQDRSFMDFLGRVYRDADKARAAWERLEDKMGIAEAERAVMENPLILGAARGWRLGDLRTPGRAEAKRMARYLGERRRRWRDALNKLGHTRAEIERARQRTQLAVRDFEAIQRVTGTPADLRARLLDKVRARARAMERVTERAFRESHVADDRKTQLERAWRKERERRLERARERERGGAFDLDLSLFRGR